MIHSDFHVHTTFSTDGKSEMADMIESARGRQIHTICFTEHMDYDTKYPEGEGSFMVDTEAYMKRNHELRDIENPDGKLIGAGRDTGEAMYGPVEVLFGVELGLQPHVKDFYEKYVSSYPFDFVIGSSHALNRIDTAFSEFWESYSSEKEAVRAYFESELECARSFDVYDVYGHLDYPLRYAPSALKSGVFDFSYSEYGDVLDEVLKTIIGKGKGIEINTAGYRKSLHRPNPDVSILERYRELGGEIITVGSDAHVTTDVAADFDLAEKALRNAGFKGYYVFRNRKTSRIDFE